MIRITKQADYGIVLMTELALGGQAAAAELAVQTHLPAPMVSKILKRLAKTGLLLSRRGIHGGYELARSAAEISVADVILALEGPIALTECSEHSDHECSYECVCRVRENWRRINRAVRSALENISIAEMARPDFPIAPGHLETGQPDLPRLITLGSSA